MNKLFYLDGRVKEIKDKSLAGAFLEIPEVLEGGAITCSTFLRGSLDGNVVCWYEISDKMKENIQTFRVKRDS